MLKEADNIISEEDSKNTSPVRCDLCDGSLRLNKCPEVARCKFELRQALANKTSKVYSTKDRQSNSNRLIMTSRIIGVLDESSAEGDGESDEIDDQAPKDHSFVLMVTKPSPVFVNNAL